MQASVSIPTVAAAELKVALLKEFKRATGPTGFKLEVEMHVPAGFSILFGRSGAGKSTLLDCIAGILEPDAGSITLFNDAANTTLFDSAARINLAPGKRRVGYVFQELALFPHMTVQQNVEYGIAALSKAKREQRTQEIMQSLHIEDLGMRRADEISGGERQRVALARTLVTGPQVLLLDEPLSALDAATKLKILDDLRAWNAAHNLPILYVTHGRGEALHIGENVFVLEQGRLVAQGEPKQVLSAVPDL